MYFVINENLFISNTVIECFHLCYSIEMIISIHAIDASSLSELIQII